jgi:hypothetical protein
MGDLIIVQKLKVKKVYEKTRNVWLRGLGDKAETEEVSDGWIIVCDDYFSFLIPSKTDPVSGKKTVGPAPFDVGDTIIMKLEKET